MGFHLLHVHAKLSQLAPLRMLSALRFHSYIICLLALVLAGCSESYEWNQKIIVVIGTPDGDVVASSVQSISYRKYKKAILPEGGSSSWKVTGEAVTVPLPNGRYIFALLEADVVYGEAHHLLQKIVYPTIGARTHEALSRAAAQQIGSRFQLAGKLLPMLVTFSDTSDPHTVLEVTSDNISEIIGEGYVIKGIYLEVTDENPLQPKIRETLPFLKYKNFNPKEEPIENPLKVKRPRNMVLPLSRFSFERVK